MKRIRNTALVPVLIAALMQSTPLTLAYGAEPLAAHHSHLTKGMITQQPNVTPDIAPYMVTAASEPQLSKKEMVKLLRQKVKYVFIIFNENHSFDNEFGTFPGVNGLYSDGSQPRAAKDTPGFNQTYTDDTGLTVTVQPFRIGPEQNASVTDSIDHSHPGLAKKINVVDGIARMDKFAEDEYTRFAKKGGAANIAEGKQFARLVMSHIDCDTIPFFWQWASRFTIFDNIFATEDTPSTPNAIAMLAGQAGESQWVKHGSEGQQYTMGTHSGTTQPVPLVNDPQPFYGSQYDTTMESRQPDSPKENYKDNNIATNLTFASQPLTFMGKDIKKELSGNRNPGFDLADIQKDIPYIEGKHTEPVNWRWYQEGYDLEATDKDGVASHNSYVTHHNGAQYFGYIANTPEVSKHLRGLGDFFNDIKNKTLPDGGVFYIRGGYTNQAGLKPAITNPNTPADEVAAINASKMGDDDHPGYTDRQLSEAMAARVINAVAGNKEIWEHCAIIITYDESDGFYDHVPPRILAYGPNKLPLSRGIRVPLLLISPYSRTHAVSHVEGDHNAVIETINYLFNLPPLATLPDEAEALAAGDSSKFNSYGPEGFHQKYLGPRDIDTAISSSLLSGFDPARLAGKVPPLPGSFAIIPDDVVNNLPHYGSHGCRSIGIVPENVRQGIANVIPQAFNPLPSTYKKAN